MIFFGTRMTRMKRISQISACGRGGTLMLLIVMIGDDFLEHGPTSGRQVTRMKRISRMVCLAAWSVAWSGGLRPHHEIFGLQIRII